LLLIGNCSDNEQNFAEIDKRASTQYLDRNFIPYWVPSRTRNNFGIDTGTGN
jgi:hypothetical protein